ncbi:kinase-like domain-containing protein [Amylocarpus encephaloides]|uniref:Kinase-like domain-containing protein n=1 Tax=Amylocarpus encephaloides TaxID=45428 RepID=A0A9P7YAS1_9HELO|nr:kinase-like domain-containing protein [Amylocarpus encephaloides]
MAELAQSLVAPDPVQHTTAPIFFRTKARKSNNTMTLYSELRRKEKCAVTEKEYIPAQRIRDAVTVQRVQEKLKGHWPRTPSHDQRLDEYVASAKMIIAILVRIGEDGGDSIRQAIAMDLQDTHLPLIIVDDLLQSRDLGKSFPFENWKEASPDLFEREQYLVMAPVVKVDGVNVRDIKLVDGCGLEFKSCQPFGEPTLFSQVYKAELRPQPNAEVTEGAESPTVVAVKKYLGTKDAKPNYEKELTNLNRIRELNNQHLIKHLAVCSNIPCIIFPWAKGHDLGVFWSRNSTCERTSELFLWAMEQLCGLADGLSALHGKSMNCRHGDMKPSNILHFTEEGTSRGLLKIADLGVSKIHDKPTAVRAELRMGVTMTTASTEVYKGPEAYMPNKCLKPRSRTYDCWSMGCIMLEFVIWLLYDFVAVANFEKHRDDPQGSHCYYSPKRTYSEDDVTECWQMTERHKSVNKAIESLRKDERCKGSAMGKVVDLVDEKLIQVDPEARLHGGQLHQRIREILDECKSSESPLPLVNKGSLSELPPVFTELPRWSSRDISNDEYDDREEVEEEAEEEDDEEEEEEENEEEDNEEEDNEEEDEEDNNDEDDLYENLEDYESYGEIYCNNCKGCREYQSYDEYQMFDTNDAGEDSEEYEK